MRLQIRFCESMKLLRIVRYKEYKGKEYKKNCLIYLKCMRQFFKLREELF